MNKKDRETILYLIDDVTVNMPWQDAVEFLEELSADIDGRVEALREENA